MAATLTSNTVVEVPSGAVIATQTFSDGTSSTTVTLDASGNPPPGAPPASAVAGATVTWQPRP